MPTDREIQDLVRLRHTVQYARRLSGDTSEWGRHTALVSLDGACEFAMLMCLTKFGEDPKKSDFHGYIDLLDRKHGEAWHPPHRRDVLDMRNARNAAQHRGLLPSPTDMPRWRDAVTVFVGTLVQATFSVDLDEVLLADALTDPVFESQAAAIERLLTAKQYYKALEASVLLLVAVRERWREQLQDAYGWMPIPLASRGLRGFLDETDRLTDYADIGVFADDLGEYHWLKAAYRHAQEGIETVEDDARRAFLFVYRWILRWQTFDASYPSDRWRSGYAEMAPPTSDRPDASPHVSTTSFVARTELGGRSWRVLDVLISDIPERGRGDWGVDMPAALREAAAAFNLTVSENAMHGDVIPSTSQPRAGRYRFLFAPTVAGETVADLLDLTVRHATTRYQARHRSAQEQAQRRQVVIDGLLEGFADDALELFGAITVELKVEGHGDVSYVRVPFRGSDTELTQVIAIFRDVAGTLADASLLHGDITFAAFDDDLQRQVADLKDAISRSTEQVRHLRSLAAGQASADEAFEQELEAARARRLGGN